MRDTLYGFEIREPDLRLGEGPRTFDIKRLWDRQHEILELNALGYKGRDIARMLGITPATVNNCLNSTLGKKAAEIKRKDREGKYEELREEVVSLTEKALAVYKEIFDEPDESGRVSLKMKKETADTVMLELSGMRAAQKVERRSINANLTAEELNAFKERGFAAARESGLLVDVKEDD